MLIQMIAEKKSAVFEDRPITKRRVIRDTLLSMGIVAGWMFSTPAIGAEPDAELGEQGNATSVNRPLTGGFGFGMLNAGYGVNVGIRTGNSLTYVSAGCEEYGSFGDCDSTQTIGHFRTGLFGMKGDRNALGVYGGRLARTRHPVAGASPTGAINLRTTEESVYGIGVGYVFFMNGIDRTGLTVGIGYEIGRSGGSTDHHEWAFQLGVQF